MLLRSICVAALACAPLAAQFRDLATTQDGAQLYFVSALRQRGTDQHLYDKIFRLDASGVSLAFLPPKPGPAPYEQYSLGPLQVDGAGAWLLYGRRQNCTGGSSCFLNEQRSATLAGAWFTQNLGANASISRDARWAVSYSSPGVMIRYAWRRDLNAAVNVNLPAQPALPPSVATNGWVLIPAYDRLLLWDGAAARTLAGAVAGAAMDDNATTVVYQTAGARLRVIDLAGGGEWPLGADDRDNTAPQLSSDGRAVLYLSRMYDGPQVFFSARDGGEWMQLTDAEGGIQEAVLSGDGSVAWALTGTGAMLRIDTATGAVDERVAPVPAANLPGPGVPGSAVVLDGHGLDRVTPRVGGLAMPVLSASGGRIVFQIPWDTPAGDTELALENSGGPFESAFPYTIQEFGPSAVPLGDASAQPVPIAVHEDFGSPVTADNPATPGEVVHIYATGLGPVDPTVATGIPSPAVPLSRATLPLRWLWSAGSELPAEVLFAGLAPGLTGFYQVDVRVPAAPDGALLGVWVEWSPPEGGRLGWLLGYVPVSF